MLILVLSFLYNCLLIKILHSQFHLAVFCYYIFFYLFLENYQKYQIFTSNYLVSCSFILFNSDYLILNIDTFIIIIFYYPSSTYIARIVSSFLDLNIHWSIETDSDPFCFNKFLKRWFHFNGACLRPYIAFEVCKFYFHFQNLLAILYKAARLIFHTEMRF